MNRKFHWYCTFDFEHKDGRTGTGCISISSEKPWFPINAANQLIRKANGYENTIVLSWKRITKLQKEEYDQRMKVNP